MDTPRLVRATACGILTVLALAACGGDDEPFYIDVARLRFARSDLPRGCRVKPLEEGAPVPNSVYRSADRSFVEWVVLDVFGPSIEADQVVEALYSIYTEDDDVGVFAFQFVTSEQAAAAAAVAKRDETRSRLFRRGNGVVLLWHDGVSEDCWAAMQSLVDDALR